MTKEILTVTNTVDLQIAMRVVRILMSDFTELDAFKLNIIDKDGDQLKQSHELKTQEEKVAFSPLMKLLIRIKQLFVKYNIKRAQAQPFVTMAGALKYIRENESLIGFDNFMSSYVPTNEEVSFVRALCEDVGTGVSSVASIPPTSNEPVVNTKNKYKKRNMVRRSGPDQMLNGDIVQRVS